MIELGLSRITALLKHTPQTWKAIHVAGTNGKGSICAYLTSMLQASRVRCGRFTSPHLIDRWDCITINDKAVSETRFQHFEDLVRKRNVGQNIAASEFELLTATAFEIFEAEKIEVGVIEVGLGGRLDATNALRQKSVTVISKIGLDHQSYLGSTLEEIALQKAGILRSGVPCVVDATNPKSVLDVVRKYADEVDTTVKLADARFNEYESISIDDFEPHQRQNLVSACEAFRIIHPPSTISPEPLIQAARSTIWPGRLQSISIKSLNGRKENVLLDGAHNSQSAKVLSNYVEKHLRSSERPVTWILAASQGKDIRKILKVLLRPTDSISAVEFGPVAGMPWVKPTNSASILDVANECSLATCTRFDAHERVTSALDWATRISNGGPLVIAGSLYLVSDVLRLIRSKRRQ